MKEIKAFVRPEEFDDMYSALKQAGFCCVTVTQCEGTGKYEDPERAELRRRARIIDQWQIENVTRALRKCNCWLAWEGGYRAKTTSQERSC